MPIGKPGPTRPRPRGNAVRLACGEDLALPPGSSDGKFRSARAAVLQAAYAELSARGHADGDITDAALYREAARKARADAAATEGAVEDVKPQVRPVPSLDDALERRVAKLIAEGRGDREIAQALQIHPARAVALDLQVRQKLGVSSRADVGRLFQA